MEHETLLEIQGWAKFGMTLVTFVIFYAWVYSIYKRDKTGEKDYEKYSKLVLDDSIDSAPLEPNIKANKLKGRN